MAEGPSLFLDSSDLCLCPAASWAPWTLPVSSGLLGPCGLCLCPAASWAPMASTGAQRPSWLCDLCLFIPYWLSLGLLTCWPDFLFLFLDCGGDVLGSLLSVTADYA